MKKISIFPVAIMLLIYCVSVASAEFDFGNKTGQCSGDGQFTDYIQKDSIIYIGEIPKGKLGVVINLFSNTDLDIQLIDKITGEKIVAYPDGLLNDKSKSSDTYENMNIEWSGYKGDCQAFSYFYEDYSVCSNDASPGNEYIKIDETKRDLIMKAYGFRAGDVEVKYSWEGTVGCKASIEPSEIGAGSFRQEIVFNDVVKVGDLVPGLTDVYIEVNSSKDIDIQLFDGNIKIVHWSEGILKGVGHQSTNYNGMVIEWSGFNGYGKGKGYEYIRITGEVDRKLTMKAYGYEAGYATVNYSWGGVLATENAWFIPFDRQVEKNTFAGTLTDFFTQTACNEGISKLVEKITSKTIGIVASLFLNVIDEIDMVGGYLKTDVFLMKDGGDDLLTRLNETTYFGHSTDFQTKYVAICYSSLGTDLKIPNSLKIYMHNYSHPVTTYPITAPWVGLSPREYLIVLKNPIDFSGAKVAGKYYLQCSSSGGFATHNYVDFFVK